MWPQTKCKVKETYQFRMLYKTLSHKTIENDESDLWMNRRVRNGRPERREGIDPNSYRLSMEVSFWVSPFREWVNYIKIKYILEVSYVSQLWTILNCLMKHTLSEIAFKKTVLSVEKITILNPIKAEYSIQ